MNLNEFSTKAISETAPELPSICLTGDAFIFLYSKTIRIQNKG